MGSDKSSNAPSDAEIVAMSPNSPNKAVGVTQSGENSHQYLKMVTNGSEWCDLCKASISQNRFFIGCLRCQTTLHLGCVKKYPRECSAQGLQSTPTLISNYQTHDLEKTKVMFKKCKICATYLVGSCVKCNYCNEVMHKKCKINVHVCEKNKYMDSNKISEVIDKSTEAKEENQMTLTRGRQTVRFTVKNSNENKPIFQDHIIFQINDDSPLYKYFLVYRSHIKIYEKQAPGSNLVYTLSFNDMIAVDTFEDPGEEYCMQIKMRDRIFHIPSKQAVNPQKLRKFLQVVDQLFMPYRNTAKMNSHSNLVDNSNFEDNFSIIRDKVLGSGHFGIVYSGTVLKTNEECAIKVIKNKGVNLDDVQREYVLIKDLNCVNIIKFHAIFASNTENQTMIVMQKFDMDLLDFILNWHEGMLGSRLSKFYTYQLVHGINYLHQNNIVHSDIKPENLLLKTGGDDVDMFYLLVITDFGLSKILKPLQSRKTKVGSPMYQAPEIMMGGSYDMRCDIWATGVSLYAMVSGQFPFESLTRIQKYLECKEDLKSLSKFSDETKYFLQRIFKPAKDRARSYQLLEDQYFNCDKLLVDVIKLIKEKKMNHNSFSRMGSHVNIYELVFTHSTPTKPWVWE